MRKKKKTNRNKNKRFQISLKQYYFFAIWLPVILPPFLWVYPLRNMFTGGSQFSLAFYGAVFGIVQYIPFALWNIFKFWYSDPREMKQFTATAPFSFVPFYAAGLLVIYTLSNMQLPSIDTFLVTIILSLASILFAYFYIILSAIIEFFLKKTGFIREEFI